MRKWAGARVGSLILAGLISIPVTPGLTEASREQKSGSKGGAGVKVLTEEQRVVHLLNRATFGPRPSDVDRVRKLGIEKFLDEQMHPDRIPDELLETRLKEIESIHLSNQELARNYPQANQVIEALKAKGITPPGVNQNQNAESTSKEGQSAKPEDEMMKRREYRRALAEMGLKPQQVAVQELQQAKILRAIYSERQLQEVLTDFWFNHFNVYIQKGADRILTTSYERDVIRPRVFGKFEDLLKATAESPAMLFYLDNFQSAAPEGAPRSAGDRERFRQRAMRDRRLGEMIGGRRNGPPAVQGERAPQSPEMKATQGKRARRGLNENYARELMELHTLGVNGGYTQKDVQEVARCFTGWTMRTPRNGAEFVFNPAMHDDGEKIVLGKKIAPGGGVRDGEAVISLLSKHPSTAKFISTKLARKFVADNPPQPLVDRMAGVFEKSGGDLREVMRAMFRSPEFWGPETYRAKIKTPFEMTISAVRAIGADSNGGPPFHRWIAQMGEGLYLAQPPTGYPDTAENWVNTGALLERMNFALALGSNRIMGTSVNLSNLTPAEGRSSPPSPTIDRYLQILLRGEVSAQTRDTITKSLAGQGPVKMEMGQAPGPTSPNTNAAFDAGKVVGLILGSPEFQRQ
jgi:uncharacterized protein (DUF1800 family)